MATADGMSSGKMSRVARRITSRVRANAYVSQGLMLASMMDILTCILFFLLKNYSTVISDFTTAKDITLPHSTALTPPIPSLQLVVTQNAIILDDKPIISVTNGDVDRKELYRDGVTIVKLAQALKAQKDRSLYIQQNNDSHSFTGTIVLQADRALSYNLLKKVIYTAGISDFVNLKLAVLKREES